MHNPILAMNRIKHASETIRGGQILRHMILHVKRITTLCFLVFSVATALVSQVPGAQPATPAAPKPPSADTLNRSTPRDAVSSFLQACRAGNYLRASDYLDLRHLPSRDQRRSGMELALQLEEVLSRNPDFDVAKLSESPEGNRTDLARRDLELVDSFVVGGRKIPVELQRVEINPGVEVWLFSADTVASIPTLSVLLGESEFEKLLPDVFVKVTFLGTALWRWLAIILLIPALGFLGRLISRAILAIVRKCIPGTSVLKRYGIQDLVGPVGLLLGVAAYGAAIAWLGPSALVRFYISRILTLLAFMAIGWIVMRVLEILSRRLHVTGDVRQQALYSSVLPLALRVAKIVIFVIALVATLSTWGFNTSTIWAGLGVGSLAVALAAQKTLENFFGGVSVIGDRPVLVGDFCRVGDMVGTIEDIGLRSTRIRTLDRTIVTVPNSQFSTMTLENFAKRDKMWFHPTFNLRLDATREQISQVMDSFTEILKDHPDVEIGGVPLRFTGIANYSFTIEIFAYVLTADGDRFLPIQSELYLKLLDAVERAGTGLAVPVRELSGETAISGDGLMLAEPPDNRRAART
jgi:MscS family membrane protein